MSFVNLLQNGLSSSSLAMAKNRLNPVLVHFDYYLLTYSKNSRVKPYFFLSLSASNVSEVGVSSIFSLTMSLSSTVRKMVSFL